MKEAINKELEQNEKKIKEQKITALTKQLAEKDEAIQNLMKQNIDLKWDALVKSLMTSLDELIAERKMKLLKTDIKILSFICAMVSSALVVSIFL